MARTALNVINDPSVEWAVITPDTAKDWLKSNKKNRRPVERTVRMYAEEMAAGDWRKTGDAIRFDDDGLLIDGQHRLHACIKSGKNFEALVIRGLATDAQDVMDSGLRRTLYHTLTIEGVKNASSCAAIATLLYRMKAERVGDAARLPLTQVKPIFERHRKEIEAAAAQVSRGQAKISIVPTAVMGVLLFADPETGVAFQNVLAKGEPAYDGDPAHYLREKILQLRAKGMLPRTNVIINTTIHVFNLFKNKLPLNSLHWKQEPQAIEGFDPGKL